MRTKHRISLTVIYLLLASLASNLSCYGDDRRPIRPRTEQHIEKRRTEDTRRTEERHRIERQRAGFDRERMEGERLEQQNAVERDRADLDRARSELPKAFAGAAEFSGFCRKVQSELIKAGCPEAVALLQGSAVTGQKFERLSGAWTGPGFDVGRTSDFDIALCSPALFERARNAGIDIRGETRTNPLKIAEMQRRLGLDQAARVLSREVGRPVRFMIFESPRFALDRSPSILITRGTQVRR